MATIEAMPKYEAYKDSGVEWLGDIPSNWSMLRIKTTITRSVNGVWGKEPKGSQDTIVLRVADFDRTRLNVLDDKLTFRSIPQNDLQSRLLKKGDLLLEKSGGGDKTLVGCVVLFNKSYKAVTSNFVAKMTAMDGYDSRFLNYVFACLYSNNINFVSIKQTTGIQNLDSNSYFNEKMPFPMIEEQENIVAFLNKKTTQIDEAIAIKEKQIALLKERKQIIIQKAVIQGLNSNAPMKDSGVDWIGEIPEHWGVKRLKYVLEERNERSKTGEEPLFMVSQIHGLVVRADYHAKAEVAASSVDNKIVHKNDLVFNKLKAHLGVFFKSNIDFKGLVSPDYAVYKCKAHIVDVKLLEILFRHPTYIGQFVIRATGIVEGLIRLYTGDLFDIPVPIAPGNEQLDILCYVEEQSKTFDRAIDLEQRQIEKLKEYKITLINSAVTGKIKITPNMLGD